LVYDMFTAVVSHAATRVDMQTLGFIYAVAYQF
jgi:hypothetical protein